MKQKEISLYLDMAKRVAEMSHAVRLKVGAVLARSDGMILSYGWNGTPSGMDNCCEDEEFSYDARDYKPAEGWIHISGKGYHRLVTKPEVLHAELNSLMKCAKEGRSTKDAWLFITHSPCIECAKLIIQAGIQGVIFLEQYRSLDGVTLLNSVGIPCYPHEESKEK